MNKIKNSNTPVSYIQMDSLKAQKNAFVLIKTLLFKDLPIIKHMDVASVVSNSFFNLFSYQPLTLIMEIIKCFIAFECNS